jgi:hypothetical protein
MAISSTYLSNPTLSINAVDLTDQCTSAVINYVAEQLENTTFSNTSRSFTSGLFSNSDHRNPLPELRSCRNRSQHLQPCRHDDNACAKASVWCNVSNEPRVHIDWRILVCTYTDQRFAWRTVHDRPHIQRWRTR